MKLSALLSHLPSIRSIGSGDPEIEALCYDSRKVGEGSAFFAMRGEAADGRNFVESAIRSGAAAVFAESGPATELERSVPWCLASDCRIAMAEAAAVLFDHPSRAMNVAGVTGTNGKTTTAFLIHHLIRRSVGRCGLFGTIKYDTGDEEITAERTTPESLDLQALLAKARDAGCPSVAMEVSSHALRQHRVHGVKFGVAVFTNLTQDHLDYHGGMDDYFEAKRILFEQTATAGGKAVINIDDSYGRRLASLLEDRMEVVTYGQGASAGFRAANSRTTLQGTQFQLYAGERSFLVEMPLYGNFNVSNALAAIATVAAMGYNLREAVNGLREAPQVPGRLELVPERRPFRVFVDYAHTPDALENVLKTLRQLRPARLITVFGCGGDRDRAKRPLMARAAEKHSDVCVVTSDNPRTEDPEQILREVQAGLTRRHLALVDRREAIVEAVNLAEEGDIVLIAGKGHEDYQQFAGGTVPFDDRKVAAGAMRGWSAHRKGGAS